MKEGVGLEEEGGLGEVFLTSSTSQTHPSFHGERSCMRLKTVQGAEKGWREGEREKKRKEKVVHAC